MDEFAQSREDDDLFADEFEPIAESLTAEIHSAASNDRPPPFATGLTGAASTRPPSGPAGHRGGRGGGGREDRRGGRGGRTKGGLASSRYAQPTAEKVEQQAESTKLDATPSLSALQGPATSPTAEALTSTIATNAIASASTDLDTTNDSTGTVEPAHPPPSESQGPQQPTRPIAVRGDRHLTGGPAHKKLTEAELSEKMERMKIVNAQKAERFRLSEEDSAAYARKEKEMAKKRVEEQKNARAMDMERARNRQRKLAAQGGREWDSEKQESDIVDGRGRGRSSEYVRGGHGGIVQSGLAGSRYAQANGEDADSVHVGRRRGGFEIRGRGSKGGRVGSRGGKPSSAKTIPTPDDFPELPSTSKPSTHDANLAVKVVKSPIDNPAEDWAEEMATPVVDKDIDP